MNLIRSRIRSRQTHEREQIADFLGRVPSEKGIGLLLNMLRDKNPYVREKVVKALVKPVFPKHLHRFNPLRLIKKSDYRIV
ncbi:MAG: HEAT repeat domain-containing protein [Desulfobacteraceae bacterium]|nr:HEAT repeat domain-containing protein [Desulfobacteraceae bacterium]